MASLDFFAVRDDHKAIIDFIIDQTDIRLFELSSIAEQELREFVSFDDLMTSYNVDSDNPKNGGAILLQLWSPSVMSKLEIQRIELKPKPPNKIKFRYTLDGFALMQLYLDGVHERVISTSHFGHNSEQRAKNWGYTSGVDWEALKKLSNKIQYHIRSRLAVAKVPGRPILKHAFELVKSGYTLKEFAQCTWQYDPVSIKSLI